ncbi:hypothetical protein VTN31DRAFT_5850 [Thermomyces dupontii]|uniref:uncharacterized protein n=1 Tax=Talaromyces thermophilus TaxID=28565 RepID=UPI003743A2B7
MEAPDIGVWEVLHEPAARIDDWVLLEESTRTTSRPAVKLHFDTTRAPRDRSHPRSKSDRSSARRIPDRWCMRKSAGSGTDEPIFLGEYKAAHKLRAETIAQVLASPPSDLFFQVLLRRESGRSDSKETKEEIVGCLDSYGPARLLDPRRGRFQHPPTSSALMNYVIGRNSQDTKRTYSTGTYLEELSKRVASKTICSEGDLDRYEGMAVEEPVSSIITELCKIPAAREHFGLTDGVSFENHANMLEREENGSDLRSGTGRNRPDRAKKFSNITNTVKDVAFIVPDALIEISFSTPAKAGFHLCSRHLDCPRSN